jgi:glycosyltransferase involved in cell wall biosynthesis
MFAKIRYNDNRANYYKYAVTKKPTGQAAKISIIVPCYNTPAKYFEPLLASVFAQGYDNWELLLVDASDNKNSAAYLKDKSQTDTRIVYVKTKNEGIAGNTNRGLAEASGELIAFLDHDDTLDPDALTETADAFAKQPTLGLVYSDEDKISEDGKMYFEPHFKPDFSLDMLRNVNYITHFVVTKKSVIDEVKGIRTGFDGAQDYDFLLRVIDTGAEVGHIPKVLYHWRQAEGSTAADFSSKKHITDAGCQALRDHYVRRGIKKVHVHAIENRPGFYRTTYDLDDTKRQIFINFSKSNLSDIEKEYILAQYRQNKDVNKYNIAVSEGRPDKANEHQLIVNGSFIPTKDTTDISALFGLASEDGVGGVAPKIIKNGRVFDVGIVKVDGNRKYLFRGVNPDRPLAFGSVEWVRDVDELTGSIGVYKHEKAQNEMRYVIWSHSEFMAFSSQASAKTSRTGKDFYNPNLTDHLEIAEEPQDHVADLIEIKK